MKDLQKVKKISLKKATSQKAQDQKNLENVKKVISKEKDLMYRYPKTVGTLPLRKKFRTDARRHLASYQRQIAKAEKAEKAKLVKEATAWATKTYEANYVPKF